MQTEFMLLVEFSVTVPVSDPFFVPVPVKAPYLFTVPVSNTILVLSF